jgi:hypothetical protein
MIEECLKKTFTQENLIEFIPVQHKLTQEWQDYLDEIKRRTKYETQSNSGNKNKIKN